MKTARPRNCKELFHLTHWVDTDQTLMKYSLNDEPKVYAVPYLESDDFAVLAGELEYKYPAYDLEYLLEKTPLRVTEDITETVLLGRSTNNEGWSIVYKNIVVIDKSPVDAVCYLLIRLYEEGHLK